MSRLPVVSGKQLVNALSRRGFVLDRQHGSHMILFRADPPTTVTVPNHRELDRGTLRAILRQAEIAPSDLPGLL